MPEIITKTEAARRKEKKRRERNKFKREKRKNKRAEKKKRVMEALMKELVILEGMGYSIERFFPPEGASDVLHHRINGCLDFWPTTRTWLDRRNYKKGKYEDLVNFVTVYIEVDEKRERDSHSKGFPTIHW